MAAPLEIGKSIMKYSLSLSYSLFFILAIACEQPFNIEPTQDDSSLLEISATVSQLPIMETAIVSFSWPTIVVDDFHSMDIIRLRVGDRATESDTAFTLQGTITNAAATGWQEELWDDVDLLYRFIIYAKDAGPIGSSDYLLEIPATTKFIVDPLIDTLAHYLDLDVVDAGDTLMLLEGNHFALKVDMTRKPGLIIMGSGAATETRIIGTENRDDDPERSDPRWFMLKFHNATLKNLVLLGGESAGEGGALTATGNTLIRNCIFVRNSAVARRNGGNGSGGAVVVNDTTIIENCIFVDNSAEIRGGDIFITENAVDIQITNCTFRNSWARFGGQSIASEKNNGEIKIINCLFDMPGNSAFSISSSNTITYSMAHESWSLPDSTNLTGKAAFISPGDYNLKLEEGSPGIDAGNPDSRYNDVDNTPNNIGAYGGPYGNW
jgi:hypothetical protein